MGRLHGPVVGGVIQIDQRVKFKKEVQSGLFYPWSEVWYVDDENGNDSYSGKGPSHAKATIQAAVSAAGKDDIIYVRAVGAVADASDFDYYPEQVTVPYAKTNLSIIGVTPHRSIPYLGPWLRYGYGAAHAGYVLLNYAPGLNLENLGFQVGDYMRDANEGAIHMYSSVTGGAYTTHAGSVGFSLYNCFIRDGNLDIEGGYNGVVDDSHFQASGNSTASWRNKSSILPSGGHQLLNSHFCEMFGDNQLTMYVLGIAGAHQNMLIKGCSFGLVPADNHYMWFGTSNTGLVCDCSFQSQDVAVGQDDAESELYVATANNIQFVRCYDKTGILA